MSPERRLDFAAKGWRAMERERHAYEQSFQPGLDLDMGDEKDVATAQPHKAKKQAAKPKAKAQARSTAKPAKGQAPKSANKSAKKKKKTKGK